MLDRRSSRGVKPAIPASRCRSEMRFQARPQVAIREYRAGDGHEIAVGQSWARAKDFELEVGFPRVCVMVGVLWQVQEGAP